MPIYEGHRAAIGTLPDLVLTPAPSLTEILGDIEHQLGESVMRGLVCNIMQHTAKSFIIHLSREEQVVEFLANGITFRSHPVKLAEVKTSVNVTLERVPYGLPGNAVLAELRQFGECKGSKVIKHKGYGLSKLVADMVLKKDIPSRISVQGNPINVFYRNQPRSCFVCSGAGHEARNCPNKRKRKRPSAPPVEQQGQGGSQDGGIPELPSFAEVVAVDEARPRTIDPPPKSTVEVSRLNPPTAQDTTPVNVPPGGGDGVDPSATLSHVILPGETELPTPVDPAVVSLQRTSPASVAEDMPAVATIGESSVEPVGDCPVGTEAAASEFLAESVSMDITKVTDPLAAILRSPPRTLLPRPMYPSDSSTELSATSASPLLFVSPLPPATVSLEALPPISIISGRKASRQSLMRKTLEKSKPYRLAEKPSLSLARTKCNPRPLPTSGQKRSQSLPSIPLENQFAALHDDGDSSNETCDD